MLPPTEEENPRSRNIDQLPTIAVLRLINSEDRLAAEAVEGVLPQVAACIEQIAERLRDGGRLFYVGAGTSGRLGVLDASEIRPTFGVSPELVRGIIAGGHSALYKSAEAVEDDVSAGEADLAAHGVSGKDAVVGLSASGRTPYVIGALRRATDLGCFTACITCVPESEITKAAETSIVAVVGPEVITGSTRMKAGTAQKMILNMISTTVMIRLGYVTGNRMTNVRPSNAKLKARSVRILSAETALDANDAANLLSAAGGDLRVALVMFHGKTDRETAENALIESKYVVAEAIESMK